MSNRVSKENGTTTVYYDGSCPLCTREIAFYRKRAADGDLCWVDVSRGGSTLLPGGLSRELAMKRFHVSSGGEIVSGARAFAVLWSALPRFRWLGKIALLKPVTLVLEGAYRLFLPLRPRLQRLFAGNRSHPLRGSLKRPIKLPWTR